MALKITNTVQTDKGSTNELYIMVNEIYVTKALTSQIAVKTFKTQAEREADINDTCKTFVIKDVYKPTFETIDIGIADVYAAVKLLLEADGFTVENV
jgi:hypothetical protein